MGNQRLVFTWGVEPVGVQLNVEISPANAGSNSGHFGTGVHKHSLHPGNIDHHSPVKHGVTSSTVATLFIERLKNE